MLNVSNKSAQTELVELLLPLSCATQPVGTTSSKGSKGCTFTSGSSIIVTYAISSGATEAELQLAGQNLCDDLLASSSVFDSCSVTVVPLRRRQMLQVIQRRSFEVTLETKEGATTNEVEDAIQQVARQNSATAGKGQSNVVVDTVPATCAPTFREIAKRQSMCCGSMHAARGA
eukprot:356761-Chlamydomonas_euryale.AAC.2